MSSDTGAVSRRALLIGAITGALGGIVGGGVVAEWDNPRFVRLRGGCGDTPPVPHSDYTVTRGVFDSRAMGAKVPWLVAMPAQVVGSALATSVVLCLTGLGDGIDMVSSGIGFPGFATAAKLPVPIAFAVPGGGGDLYWHPRADGRDPLVWLVDGAATAHSSSHSSDPDW